MAKAQSLEPVKCGLCGTSEVYFKAGKEDGYTCPYCDDNEPRLCRDCKWWFRERSTKESNIYPVTYEIPGISTASDFGCLEFELRGGASDEEI